MGFGQNSNGSGWKKDYKNRPTQTSCLSYKISYIYFFATTHMVLMKCTDEMNRTQWSSQVYVSCLHSNHFEEESKCRDGLTP